MRLTFLIGNGLDLQYVLKQLLMISLSILKVMMFYKKKIIFIENF